MYAVYYSLTYTKLLLQNMSHGLVLWVLPIFRHVLCIELVSKCEADQKWYLLFVQPLQPLLG